MNPTPRFWLQISTTITPATAISAIFKKVTLAGGAARLLARRRASRVSMYAPASTTAAIMTIQLAARLMVPPSMASRTVLSSRIVPPAPGAAMSMIASSRPNPPRYPASVTTKDGSLSLVMMTPSSPAKAALNASPVTTASHRGRFDESIQSVITAPRAALYPTDRSISPSRSTKTSAMPNVTMNAAWVMRLTRLPADRNSELRTWK